MCWKRAATMELMTSPVDFPLRGAYIPLDALPKATGLAPSGGSARMLISEGQVRVDGQVETRKTCKIRSGQMVTFGNERIAVKAGPPPPAAA